MAQGMQDTGKLQTTDTHTTRMSVMFSVSGGGGGLQKSKLYAK